MSSPITTPQNTPGDDDRAHPEAPHDAQGARYNPSPDAEPTSPSTPVGLDGRSRVAVAARRFKVDSLADLGGNPSRAQETIAELAARQWLLVSSPDDGIARQKSLVTKQRTVTPVLLQRETIAMNLLRLMTALGLERRAVPATDLATYSKRKAAGGGSE